MSGRQVIGVDAAGTKRLEGMIDAAGLAFAEAGIAVGEGPAR